MSSRLKRIIAQASGLKTLSVPNEAPVISRIKEINQLGQDGGSRPAQCLVLRSFCPEGYRSGIVDGSGRKGRCSAIPAVAARTPNATVEHGRRCEYATFAFDVDVVKFGRSWGDEVNALDAGV